MAYQKQLTNLTELFFDLHSCMTVWKNISSAQSGLSPSQINALEIIGHNYSLKMKGLAARLGVTRGSLSVMIDRLEEKGFVSRKAAEDDRRSTMVFLTEKGRSVFLSRYKQQLEFINKSLKGLGRADKETLHTALAKILNQIQSSIR